MNGVIARLSAHGHWIISGQLKTPRYGHNVIFDGELMIVVGGASSNMKTEICEIDDGAVMCSEQNPVLTNYYYYPELLLVPDNYCAT